MARGDWSPLSSWAECRPRSHAWPLLARLASPAVEQTVEHSQARVAAPELASELACSCVEPSLREQELRRFRSRKQPVFACVPGDGAQTRHAIWRSARAAPLAEIQLPARAALATFCYSANSSQASHFLQPCLQHCPRAVQPRSNRPRLARKRDCRIRITHLFQITEN